MTSVSQVGTDRIIEIRFSDGQYRLFFEFYAGGNVVLTDADSAILALLRNVPEGPGQEELRLGLKYSLDNRQNYHGVPRLTVDRLRNGLQTAAEKEIAGPLTQQKKAKRKEGDGLRKAIATSLPEFPPMLVDHALRVVHFDTTQALNAIIENDSLLKQLMKALEEAQRVIEIISASNQSDGFIIAHKGRTDGEISPENEQVSAEHPREGLKYHDFQPFKPQQFVEDESITILEFKGFNATVDEFFSSAESQKLESRLSEREQNAKRKLENAKLDHQKRIGGLQEVQAINVRKARTIELNRQRVQEAIAAVNSLLAQGMDWQNVARLIEVEQGRQNVVAETIKLPLKLYENTITLLLLEESFEDEADFEGDETDSDVSDSEAADQEGSNESKKTAISDPRLAIDVDLALSAWSNARQYYEQKKVAAVKEQKTLQSSAKALKSTERKIGADLKKGLKQERELLRPQRMAHWFEKFIFFISSEGYLVLGAKDAQQTEIVYNRHLERGDVFVHADLNGASPVVVKNKPGRANDPIPPSTLSQAGTLVVATSSAWDSKAVMSAWWVMAEQVSKTTANGDFLSPGNFHVKGEKRFLPPAQLLLGFGLMFKISEESKTRHHKHRINDDAPEPANKPHEIAQAAKKEPADAQEAEDPDLTYEHENDETLSESASDIDDLDDHDEDGNSGEPEHVAGELHDLEETEDAELGPGNPLQPDGVPEHSANADEVKSNPGEGSEGGDQGVSGDDASADGKVKEDGEDLSRTARQSLGNETATFEKTQTSNTASSAPSDTAAASTKSSKPKEGAGHQIRGKRGKRNKLKTKYADQDDEDRALAMRLLGSAAAEEKAKDDAAAKAAKEHDQVEQKERRRQQHAKAADKGRQAEEARRRKFEEGDNEGEEPEANVVDLDSFTGSPLPGDEILDAFVVCGPWDAIGARFRWRVKLQPGTTKKGKAVREILSSWNRMTAEAEKKKRGGSGEGNETMEEESKIRRREAELIRNIKETEVIGAVPVGKVRVILGGSEKAAGAGRGGGSGKAKRGGKGSKKK